jgi:RNA-directed DNA polymerase
VSLCRNTDNDPEPKDKLDSMMTSIPAAAASPSLSGVAVLNGPEDETTDWLSIDWQIVEEDVRRLRQRIFTASQAGDLKRVRNLQKLMLRSRANTLLSVRRVAEQNAGRKTAGIDGHVVLMAPAKAELADWAQHRSGSWDARPVKRVYIPKAGGKRRPLGIPVVVDRVLQARVVNALEPEWEARFEPKSYGFRPGRGCQDAIAAIFNVAKGANPQRRWVLDADLAAAFDRIDHQHLLSQLGTFPARGQIADWLMAGVVEKGRFAPTEEGTPQGGVISPLLLNVALHGMEDAAGVRYRNNGECAGEAARTSSVLIRYADDLVALCHSEHEAMQVKARLAAWLAPRGLAFNEDKTRIVPLDKGFDFLGFTVRRQSGKLLIKPSQAALRRIRERLRTEMRALRGANAEAVIKRLNPIIRGWAAYYRTVVSSKAFGGLDDYMWKLTYKWAKHGHPNKSRRWIVKRYFDAFNKSRRDRWVFGDRESGAYLAKFAWTKIVRHQLVKGQSSPDDPALIQYWVDRRRKGPPLPMDRTKLRLLFVQHGRCPVCQGLLLHADRPPQSPREWEQWLVATRKALIKKYIVAREDGTPGEIKPRLIHAQCQRLGDGTGTALLPASEPRGACLSRMR